MTDFSSWDEAEVRWAEEAVRHLFEQKWLDSSAGPTLLIMSSHAGKKLLDGVHESPRYGRKTSEAAAVRHLYRLLGFDERYSCSLRLENKLIQALFLHVLIPGVAPVTQGLSTFIANTRHCDARSLGMSLGSLHIKRVRGYGSPKSGNSVSDVLHSPGYNPLTTRRLDTQSEEWLVQERLSIREEYRVHSVENQAVPDLTSVRHQASTAIGDKSQATLFVSALLKALPVWFWRHSICGWDVARTVDGQFRVIEVNYAGYHPVCDIGFQCSGFFQRQDYGSLLIARLMRFIENQYTLRFTISTADTREELDSVYAQISGWLSFLRLSQQARALRLQLDGRHACGPPPVTSLLLNDLVAKMCHTVELIDESGI